MEPGRPGNALRMSTYGTVAVGGSAGSVEALVELVAGLPADLPATVLVTVHIGSSARSSLPRILERAGPLPAVHARHGEPLLPGHIYVAPPDLHLLVTDGTARLSSGPRVNRHRPAVDVMFASAARWAGTGLVALVLSGMLDDGAVGAALTARAGGRVVVQDPADALFASMPRAALSAVPAAVAAPAAGLAELVGTTLADLLGRRGDGETAEEGDGAEVVTVGTGANGRMSESDDPAFLSAEEVRLTRLSCPECSGGLAEAEVTGLRYYRCHVGHQYSPQSLEVAQRESVESKLWAAAAALEEHAAMARHLAARPTTDGTAAAQDYRRLADRSARTARALVSGLQDRDSGRGGDVVGDAG